MHLRISDILILAARSMCKDGRAPLIRWSMHGEKKGPSGFAQACKKTTLPFPLDDRSGERVQGERPSQVYDLDHRRVLNGANVHAGIFCYTEKRDGIERRMEQQVDRCMYYTVC
jgi:hypothetical protein